MSGNGDDLVDNLGAIMDLADRGFRTSDISKQLGLSNYSIQRTIARIREKEGVFLNYRAVQSLRLTELQARILEEMTDEKIQEASLKDLAVVYKVLSSHQTVLDLEEKGGKIKGLLHYLIELEKQELAAKGQLALTPVEDQEQVEDAEFSDILGEEEDDD